ncbi:MAG: hypothetical protein ACO2OX_05365 [Candidatus Nanopusillus sp.]
MRIDIDTFKHRYLYFERVIEKIRKYYEIDKNLNKFKPIYVFSHSHILYIVDGIYRYIALKDLVDIKSIFIPVQLNKITDGYFFILNLKHKNKLKLEDIGVLIDNYMKKYFEVNLKNKNDKEEIWNVFVKSCFEIFYFIKNRLKNKDIIFFDSPKQFSGLIVKSIITFDDEIRKNLLEYIHENKIKLPSNVDFDIDFNQKIKFLSSFSFFLNFILDKIRKKYKNINDIQF